MSRLREVVQRYPILAFVALACLFGWSIWIGVFVSGGSGGINLPIAPIMAALIVSSCQGRAQLRAWARRLRSWRADPKWYLLAVLAPVVLHTLIVLTNGGLGAPLPTSAQLSHWPDVPVTFVVLLVLIGIGEEAGWTAFMAPILLRRHGLLTAWAIASVVRILWHVPLMISGDLNPVLGTVGNAAFTMVLLMLLVVRGGNWSLAAVWHASLNSAGGSFFFTMVDGADATRLSLLMSAEYAVVAVIAYLTVRREDYPHNDVDRRRHEPGSTDVDRHAPTRL